jgi:hypothetical protein
MAGSVHIPWYATGFRGDGLEEALSDIAPVALRYGATHYAVYRYRDDRHKFLQVADFEDKLDWERYWGGPEFERFRVVNTGRFQVPVVYAWADVAVHGSLPGNGAGTAEPTALAGGGDGGDTF